jgi:hypothetical protein
VLICMDRFLLLVDFHFFGRYFCYLCSWGIYEIKLDVMAYVLFDNVNK